MEYKIDASVKNLKSANIQRCATKSKLKVDFSSDDKITLYGTTNRILKFVKSLRKNVWIAAIVYFGDDIFESVGSTTEDLLQSINIFDKNDKIIMTIRKSDID
jgi:hypothetical protein